MSEKPLVLKVFRIDRSLPLPYYATEGSVALDLFCRETIEILPGTFALLPLNVILADYDPRTHPIVACRSSLPSRKGLIVPNGLGIIDLDYRGKNDELKLPVFYPITREHILNESFYEPLTIFRGEKIAQVEFICYVKPTVVEVFEVDERSRGGLGSTAGYMDNL